MFETSFSHVSESTIDTSTPSDLIIKLMHDFDLIVKLNPDCKGYVLVAQHGQDTWEYRVEDYLAFIPKKLWNGGVSYTATYKIVEDGCDITVKAPGGFTSVNHWRLVVLAPDKRLVRITSDAICNRTFAGFVKKFLENSHGQLHRGFAERVAQISRPGLLRRRSSWPNNDH
ncbi:hypothetical protein AAFC00_006198 [Neodothiora populina]|uniref:DUF7053 domain-containing protein n=1 Tax=Neodothiora populina TaxID=2781224 RepID=A0ABR3P4M8_9PEZI